MKNYSTIFFLMLSAFAVAQVSPDVSASVSQKFTPAEKSLLSRSEKLIERKSFVEAEPLMDSLFHSYPDEEYLNYLNGVIKSYIPGKQRQALQMIKNAYGIHPSLPEYDYNFAYALELNERYDEAVKIYDNLLKANPPAAVKSKLQHRIEFVTGAKQRSGKNIQLRDAGKSFNTANNEYAACFPADERFIIFSSAAQGKNGDLFISEKQESGWSAPTPVAALNSPSDDVCTSVSADGKRVLISRRDGNKADIYLSTYSGSAWSTPEKLKGLNTAEWEGAACFTPDEMHIIFSSKRSNGMGGSDLWIAEMLKDGSWGNVQNLSSLNTGMDEDTPYLTADGNTLIFSSNRSGGNGGFDIYMSDKDENGWTRPVEVAKSVNFPQDDRFYYCTADGERAFFSSSRPGGAGGSDIYNCIPGKPGRPVTLVQVYGTAVKDTVPVEAEIFVNSAINGKMLFLPKTTGSNGKFLVNLPAGNMYDLVIKSAGAEQRKKVNTTFVDSFYRVNVMADFLPSPSADAAKKFEAERDVLALYGNHTIQGLEYVIDLGLASLPANLDYTQFIGIRNWSQEGSGDSKRVIISGYKTYKQAVNDLQKLNSDTFPALNIYAIYNGSRMAVSELIKSGILK